MFWRQCLRIEVTKCVWQFASTSFALKLFCIGYPFKWEQHLVETLYSMITFLRHDRVLHATEKGEERAKQWRDREGERQSVAVKGLPCGQ
jgi:hypothetical protein